MHIDTPRHDREPLPEGFATEVSGITISADATAARILALLPADHRLAELPPGYDIGASALLGRQSAAEILGVGALNIKSLAVSDYPGPYVPPEGWHKLDHTRVADQETGINGAVAAVFEKITSTGTRRKQPKRDLELCILDPGFEPEDPRWNFIARDAIIALELGFREGARGEITLRQQLGPEDTPQSQAVDHLSESRLFKAFMVYAIGSIVIGGAIKEEGVKLSERFLAGWDGLRMIKYVVRGPSAQDRAFAAAERAASFGVVQAIVNEANLVKNERGL